MIYKAYRNILSALSQPNVTLLQDNDPKRRVKATNEFFIAKKCNLLDWPSQSHNLNLTEHVCHWLKKIRKAKIPLNKQERKTAAVAYMPGKASPGKMSNIW